MARIKLEALKRLCEEECYKELDECSYIRDFEGAGEPHLVVKALKEILASAEERGCDPSKALKLLLEAPYR